MSNLTALFLLLITLIAIARLFKSAKNDLLIENQKVDPRRKTEWASCIISHEFVEAE